MDKLLRHYLLPGEVFVSRQGHMVTTILGSCVSLCLWDSVRKIGGINHYLLPLWGGEGIPTSRYGDVAIDELIHRMAELGCHTDNLVAKIFGGARMLTERYMSFAIGTRNVQLAEQLMSERGIPVVAADTEGTIGRRLIFNTRTGVVLLRKRSEKTKK